jgi:hypothetical protein
LDPLASHSEPLRKVAERNTYFRWLLARMDRNAFAEKADQSPPEALLQQAWLYQRLLQDKLRTTDGRPVKVLHPGFWNREPGPDFKKAVVQIGSEPAVVGDVEIDLVPAGWKHHSHAGNPAYREVVLHVTWEPETSPANLPTLSLKHALDSTVPELSFWLGMEPKPAPKGLAGQCSGPLRNLLTASVAQVLRQAAETRLLRKAEQLQSRARQVGWEGALWEAMFGALGYKRNVWPMRQLGGLLAGISSDVKNLDAFTLQARLLGIGGMLPTQAPGGEASDYVRRAWDLWWREADEFGAVRLPAAIWNLGGIRPANHPQRRIAVGAHWGARRAIPKELDGWIQRTIESPDLVFSLSEIIQVKQDDFWSYRWTLKSAPFRQPQPLLGEQRITDLAINVIIPWLYVRALAGRNELLAKAAEARYFLWPAGEDNSVLKLARQRLFGGAGARFIQTAAQQQGIMQIVRDFCDHSDALCTQCQFPGMIQSSVVREIGSEFSFTNLNS